MTLFSEKYLQKMATLPWHSPLCILLQFFSLSSLFAFNAVPVTITPYYIINHLAAYYPLLIASLLLLILKNQNYPVKILFQILLSLFVYWDVVSFFILQEQGRHLLWFEIDFYLGDQSTRNFLFSFLWHWYFLIIISSMLFSFFCIEYLLKRIKSKINFLIYTSIFSITLFSGTFFTQMRDHLMIQTANHHLEQTLPPWAHQLYHNANEISSINEKEAKLFLNKFSHTVYEKNTKNILQEIAGKYKQRDIVVFLLESHRASDMEIYGDSSQTNWRCSPHLSELANNHIYFQNYFANGYATSTALWSLFTSLPLPLGSPPPNLKAPHASQWGTLKKFKQHGYEIEGLCPAANHIDNWDQLLKNAGAKWWLDKREYAHFKDQDWAQWGMHDHQLYEVFWNRFQYNHKNKPNIPHLYVVLTVSNHHPFEFPTLDGISFTSDHKGGMQYADYALHQLIKKFLALPESKQPILFITADTSHRHSLSKPQEQLEALQIPGILILPGSKIRQKIPTPFSHEDTFDLLAYLTFNPLNKKIQEYERKIAICNGGKTIISQSHVLINDTLYQRENHWQLNEETDQKAKSQFQEIGNTFRNSMNKIWSK